MKNTTIALLRSIVINEKSRFVIDTVVEIQKINYYIFYRF